MLHLLSHSQHKADPFRSYKGEPHNLAFMLSFYEVVVLQFHKWIEISTSCFDGVLITILLIFVSGQT